MVLELKRINFLLFIISLAYVFSMYQFIAFTPAGIIIYALLFMVSFIFSFLVTDKFAIIKYLFLLMTFRGIGLIYTLPEDEDAIRMMAGYYLLHGLNPYLPMPTVFSHYYVPVGLRTLTEYGGFVERLIYPGLSVFAGVVEYEVGYMIYNTIIYSTTILIAYYYLRNSFSESVIFSILWLLFGGANLSTLLLTLGILLKRYNGFFVGLAISYNQLYVLIAPFLIIHYYFSGKRALLLKQIVYAITGFLITNLPFMVWNFKLWFSAMLYSISQPIIPIGFSISRETLLGFFIIPFQVYEYTFIALYIISIIFYALLYKSIVKWTYLFPAIAMIAYPRTLLGYITSWVLPAFFFYYSKGEEVDVVAINRIKTAVLIAILIAPIFVPLFVHVNVDVPFSFRVTKVYVGNYGNVYKMSVNITVYSKNVKNITFVLVPNFYPFYNTYLWWSTVNVTQGINYVNITPLSPSQEIGFVNASYTVIGVYGSYYYFQTLILIQNGTEFSNFTYVPNNNN